MATRLTTILVIVIVGATFIAGLIVGAQRDDATGPVDLIIVNGKVYPGGGAELEEAVAVRGSQILRVGSNRDVKRLRRSQTVVVDAHGATVLPGLNDSHVELLAGALALEQLNLSPAATADEIGAELRRYAAEKPQQPWLIARNADDDILGALNAPARQVLDAAVEDRPVFVTSEDGTIAWANSKALELAGIHRKTRNPASGIVVRERRTGEPTGVLKDAAVNLVSRVVPPKTRVEKIAALRTAIDEAHKVGVTSLQSVSASAEELELLDEIRKQGDLRVRVYASIAVSPAVTEDTVRDLDRLRTQYPDDPALKVGGVVVTCPCEEEQLEHAIAVLDRHNWTVMVRTANGADVRAAVGAFELAEATSPDVDRRHRLDEGILSKQRARVLAGSNWPEGSLDPRDVIERVAGAGELRSAIDAYTSHAAYASFDEHRKGTLARGMLADIVILSTDVLDSDEESLSDAVVTVTIFDGRVVYQRPVPVSSND